MSRFQILPFLAGLLFVSFALYFFVFSGRDLLQHIKASFWEEVPCTILHSKVGENKKEDAFCAEITYKYVINYKKYTGERIYFSDNPSAVSFAEAKTLVGRYPEKSQKTCLVNPENPEDAVLELGSAMKYVYVILFLLVFGAFGVGVILISIWPILERKNKTAQTADVTGEAPIVSDSPFVQPASKPHQKSPSKKHIHHLLASLFGLPFLSGGIFVGVFTILLPWLELRESQDWVETPCVIEKSMVKSGRTYSVNVRYSYKWNGEKLIGERYNFARGSDSDYSSKKEAVDKYPKNKKTVCYVNPEKPLDAVLVREIFTGTLMIWLPALLSSVFTLVGLWVIVNVWVSWRKQNKLPESQPGVTTESAVWLKAKRTPLRSFTEALVRMFILGVVAGVGFFFFLKSCLEQIFSGKGLENFKEWIGFFILSFLTIFFLYSVVATVLLWFSTWGPKLGILMKPVLRLGEEAALTWCFRGDVRSMKTFTLTLLCEKEDGKSDGEIQTLQEIKLLEMHGPLTFQEGTISFQVPLDVAVSDEDDEGHDMEIHWQVKAVVSTRGLLKQKWVFAFSVVS